MNFSIFRLCVQVATGDTFSFSQVDVHFRTWDDDGSLGENGFGICSLLLTFKSGRANFNPAAGVESGPAKKLA